MGKVEGSTRKLSQNKLFHISPNFITEGNFRLKNMKLRASQPFGDYVAVFPSKALEK